jgi:hypothetical protein
MLYQRQYDGHGGTRSQFGINLYLSFVALNNPVHDGQSQSYAVYFFLG